MTDPSLYLIPLLLYCKKCFSLPTSLHTKHRVKKIELLCTLQSYVGVSKDGSHNIRILQKVTDNRTLKHRKAKINDISSQNQYA